jgi:nucleotide-binding universal stress UspA family protein
VPHTNVIGDGIVVPLDGSTLADHAVPVALRLLSREHAKLVLLAVGSDDRGKDLRRHVRDIEADTAGVRVESVVVPGWDAAKVIVEYADAHDATICMTSHGRGALRWAMVGSVAEWVLEAASRPVILVGPHCAPSWVPGSGPILLCHDGAPMPDNVVEAACDAAHRFDTSILVATVIHPLDDRDQPAEAARFEDVEHRIASRGCSADHTVVQHHFPAGVLADLAGDRTVPLVVMAVHSRHGLERFVVGSTTMAVLHLAPCPVVAVNPTAGTTRL